MILSGTGLRYRPHDYRRGGRRERGLGWGPSQNVSASDSSTLPPSCAAFPPRTLAWPHRFLLSLSQPPRIPYVSLAIFTYRRGIRYIAYRSYNGIPGRFFAIFEYNSLFSLNVTLQKDMSKNVVNAHNYS